MKDVALEMKKRRADDTMEEKVGWYYRHWKGMGIDPASAKTHSL